VTTIVALIQLFAFSCLAFSMQKHHKVLKNNYPSIAVKPRGLVILGWLGLVLSLWVSMVTSEVLSIALVWWFCTLSLAVFAVALYLSHLIHFSKE
jgi:uncharacterized protein YacL